MTQDTGPCEITIRGNTVIGGWYYGVHVGAPCIGIEISGNTFTGATPVDDVDKQFSCIYFPHLTLDGSSIDNKSLVCDNKFIGIKFVGTGGNSVYSCIYSFDAKSTARGNVCIACSDNVRPYSSGTFREFSVPEVVKSGFGSGDWTWRLNSDGVESKQDFVDYPQVRLAKRIELGNGTEGPRGALEGGDGSYVYWGDGSTTDIFDLIPRVGNLH